jgi:hypothetical protein
MSKNKMVKKWKSFLKLNSWNIVTVEIEPEQVMYDEDIPQKDRYYVGIDIDHDTKTGVIYHDRLLKEEYIIHELLHVKYPKKDEEWIVNKTDDLFRLIQLD